MERSLQQQPVTLCRILYETDRVYRIQPRRFLTLVFLFLFPIFTASLLLRTLTPLYSHPAIPIAGDVGTLLLSLALFPSAVASITYTAFHSFNGGYICLRTALKSISTLFFPVVATTLAIGLLVALALTAFAGLNILTSLFVPPPVTPYFRLLLSAITAVVIIYLLASWSLAYPLVVAEAVWGFEPLRRSRALIKGKKRIVWCLSVLLWLSYIIFGVINVLVMGLIVALVRRQTTHYDHWLMAILTFANLFLVAAFAALLVQYKFLANTVLYVFCKASSGDYVPLPASDGGRIGSIV